MKAYIEPAPKQAAPEVEQGGLSLASLTAAHRELCRITTERAAHKLALYVQRNGPAPHVPTPEESREAVRLASTINSQPNGDKK